MNNKIIEKYRHNALLLKYWSIITLAILIPFSITNILIGIFYVKTLYTELYSNQVIILNQMQSQAERIVKSTGNIYSSFQTNFMVLKFMQQEDIYSDTAMEQTQLSNELFKHLMYTLNSNNYISSIYLYNAKSRYIFSNKYTGFIENAPFKASIEEYNYQKSKYPHSQKIILFNKGETFFSLCYDFLHSDNDKNLIIINVDKDVFNIPKDDSNTVYTIADFDGSILTTSDKTLTDGNIFNYITYQNIFKNADFNKIFKKKSGGYLFTLLKENSGLSYVVKTKNLFKSKKAIELYIILFVCIIATLIVSFVAAFILSGYLYRSIANIILSIDGKKSCDTKEDKQKKNVLLYILNNIARSTPHQNPIDVSNQLMSLQKSQSIALQSQITPHFLYNTLQSINLVVLRNFKGDNEASLMIVLFSEILKQTLDTKTYLVPLKKEIEFEKKYLELQSIKYRNKFTVNWSIDENTLDCNVIKLSLQPILENAIHHGIIPLGISGVINISTSIKKNLLCIKVTNNGVPIPERKLFEIHELLSNEGQIQESQHIGLSNVSQRIKLVFGPEYGCNITSNHRETSVEFTIPINKSED